MLKSEIYKIFIKHKLLIAICLFCSLTVIISLSYTVPTVESGYRGNEFSCGAAVFLNRDNVNFLLSALIIFFAIKIWIVEYTSEMQTYNLTARKGRHNLAIIKLCIFAVIVILMTLFSDIVTFISYSAESYSENIMLSGCGMDYETTTREITADSIVIRAVLIHIVGYLCFALQCSFFAVILKSPVTFTGVMLVILTAPVYIFSDLSDRLRMPFVVSLMQSGSMFKGSIMFADNNTEFAFKELSDNEIIFNITAQGIIALMLAAFCIILFSGKKIALPKKLSIASFLIIPVAFFSGCAQIEDNETSKKDNYFLISGTDKIYSKNDKKIFSVNPTPLSNRTAVSVSGDYVLVWENSDDAFATYQIKSVKLPQLSETVLLTIGKSVNENGFLGLSDLIEIPLWLVWDENYMLSRDFAYSDNKLFFFSSDSITVYDIKTESKTVNKLQYSIINPTVESEDIYFIKENGRLCKNYEELTDFEISCYKVCGNTIAYKKKDGSITVKSSNQETTFAYNSLESFLYCDENSCVFTTDKGTVAIKNGKEIFFDYYMDYADKDCVYRWDENGICEERY